QASSVAQVDTIYSADSIEWCPHSPYRDIFTCGTYQVLEPEPTAGPSSSSSSTEVPKREMNRTGRLYLFQVGNDQQTLEELERIDTAAVLDVKWSPRLDPLGQAVVAVADAKGWITIYALNNDKRLHLKQRLEIASSSTLCLSIDWSTHQNEDDFVLPNLIVSLSDGTLAHLTATSTGELEVDQQWKAHDFEPWITAFDPWDPHVIWSGGDDCKLKRWDLRSTSFPTLVNKSFEAGVTTITPSPHTPYLLAVGSYDAQLRIFDSRNARSPLRTIDVGGGIWRTRFHPDIKRAGDVLVACMHDGFKVVRLGSETDLARILVLVDEQQDVGDASQIVTRFDEHASLAYGADWSRLSSDDHDDKSTLVATCSFYDHSMHLWR
ncbi:WD40-repeat-containing domain protein, partial [Naematelia encephala]